LIYLIKNPDFPGFSIVFCIFTRKSRLGHQTPRDFPATSRAPSPRQRPNVGRQASGVGLLGALGDLLTLGLQLALPFLQDPPRWD